MKRRYMPDDPHWHIEQGSVLDQAYLSQLGLFDIVYSWGVLHHTGAMWQALENVDGPVKPGGKLFIAIYNDQGIISRLWWAVKWLYVHLPVFLKWLVLIPVFIRLWLPTTLKDMIRGRPFHTWNAYIHSRGMSPWWDVVDWVGGYPYEAAPPEAVITFYQSRSYTLLNQKINRRVHGCNEFVFEKSAN
jgi:2-polyprenyl-6-hydroxyphenyl methylase/3-demethylubiquinone-9 3-methyltransferase